MKPIFLQKPAVCAVLATLSLALTACSDTPSMQTDASTDRAAPRDGTGLDGSDDGSSMDADASGPGDVADVTQDSTPAGLGERCNASRPCPGALACVEGLCRLDCGGNARCATPERCCAANEVCAGDACVLPGMACTPTPGCGGAGVGLCPEGQYCDATIMRCLSTAAARMCTVPASASFRPVEAWSWTGSRANPAYRGVLVTPIVADVDRDGASDVLVIAYRDPPAAFGGSITAQSILCALAGPGDCAGGPRELFCTDPAIELNAWGNIAVADLDQTDGVNELTIIAGLRRGPLGGDGIVAFNARGARLWEGHTAAGPSNPTVYAGGIAIADLDADGRAEIIVGNSVFDHTGLLRWRGTGTCWGTFGPHSFAVDLSSPPDGQLEVVCGNTVYANDGRVLWTGAGIGGGWGGAADFDSDGVGEVVVISAGNIAAFRNDGRPFVAPTTFASLGLDGQGGTPTIADLDADGIPEIGIAGATQYAVLRVAFRGGVRVFERVWRQPADDASSSSTGSAMFDFDGDGQYEVIYQDTCRARVFAGRDGAVVMDIPNISGTASNYPTVADLNADGRAEFVLVSDSYYARSGLIPCPATTPRTDGVRVFRDANDNWRSTRGIWNQHTYHVTNVCDGVDSVCDPAENRHGAVPRRARPPWAAGTNAFRVNAQLGAIDRAAPDLVTLSAAADVSACPARYTVRADIGNRGSLVAPGETPVSFYEQVPGAMRRLLGTVTLGRALAPGGSVRVTLPVMPAMPGRFEVIVVPNDNGMGARPFRECNTDNNASVPLTIDCTLIG
ncbi:MAG: FG-GAP-like repeat-containing protein [Deltaproteobacteria bacterium]|nr:FG-GAP-like repeat-containing protein [Deltaproteobacteria bacterium]